MRWGVLVELCAQTAHIHARTTGGAGVYVTRRLLRALAGADLYLAGKYPVVIDSTESAEDWPLEVFREDLPVETIRIGVVLDTGWRGNGTALILETILDGEALRESPLVLLASSRPHGWPA